MRLLVSVRNPAEALEALKGGAELVDVKEPANGPMGKADDATVTEVAKAVGEEAPLSVAMGELYSVCDLPHSFPCRFLKFGLADAPKDWQRRLRQLQEALPDRLVPVAYAEGQAVGSPSIEEVAEWAIKCRAPALLVDTCLKNGRTLLDHAEVGRLQSTGRLLREAGLEFAVAGSLRIEHLGLLRVIAPAWVGVRGAVCGAGGRSGTLDRHRVVQFRAALNRSGVES